MDFVALLGDAWRRPGASALALADTLRSLVVDGRVPVRTRVPSERDLAAQLGVSRGSVSRAYDRLRADGYLTSARGAGSWLVLPDGAGPGTLPLGPYATDGEAGVVDLTIAALPAPSGPMLDATARAMDALPRHLATHGYAPAGLPALREAVAARFTARGLPTSAGQILITCGAQHALHLLLGLLGAPGDRALVDAPAYPRGLGALRAQRLRAVPVPLLVSPRETRWDVDAWRSAVAAAAPRLALTVPDHHNPTGATMDPAARRAIVLACARAGCVLIADETASELRMDGAPVPPLACEDPGGTVVTIGTMSKAVWAGLRVGWLRASPTLVAEVAQRRAAVDMANPVLDQLVAIELLEDFDEVVRSRVALLRERRDVLLAALARAAPEGWSATIPDGGLSTWVGLPAPVATALSAAAAVEGIRVAPGPAFSVDGTFERNIRFPFTLPPDVLTDAVGRLVALTDRLGSGARVEGPYAGSPV